MQAYAFSIDRFFFFNQEINASTPIWVELEGVYFGWLSLNR